MTNAPLSLLDTCRLLPLGDAALTVEFGRAIDPLLSARVLAFAGAVRAQAWPGVLDVVPTYAAATVHVDPLRLPVEALMERVRGLLTVGLDGAVAAGARHRIPVLYGGEWGPDLAEVAAFAELSEAAAVALHTSVSYRVYMLGFSPGFPYMGTVPEPIAMPRLSTPRTSVPAGSIGIAGNQTGIYPISTPGGWRIIGRTPLRLFRRKQAQPFLLRPGDVVTFEPVVEREYDRLERASDADAD